MLMIPAFPRLVFGGGIGDQFNALDLGRLNRLQIIAQVGSAGGVGFPVNIHLHPDLPLGLGLSSLSAVTPGDLRKKLQRVAAC